MFYSLFSTYVCLRAYCVWGVSRWWVQEPQMYSCIRTQGTVLLRSTCTQSSGQGDSGWYKTVCTSEQHYREEVERCTVNPFCVLTVQVCFEPSTWQFVEYDEKRVVSNIPHIQMEYADAFIHIRAQHTPHVHTYTHTQHTYTQHTTHTACTYIHTTHTVYTQHTTHTACTYIHTHTTHTACTYIHAHRHRYEVK